MSSIAVKYIFFACLYRWKIYVVVMRAWWDLVYNTNFCKWILHVILNAFILKIQLIFNCKQTFHIIFAGIRSLIMIYFSITDHLFMKYILYIQYNKLKIMCIVINDLLTETHNLLKIHIWISHKTHIYILMNRIYFFL